MTINRSLCELSQDRGPDFLVSFSDAHFLLLSSQLFPPAGGDALVLAFVVDPAFAHAWNADFGTPSQTSGLRVQASGASVFGEEALIAYLLSSNLPQKIFGAGQVYASWFRLGRKASMLGLALSAVMEAASRKDVPIIDLTQWDDVLPSVVAPTLILIITFWPLLFPKPNSIKPGSSLGKPDVRVKILPWKAGEDTVEGSHENGRLSANSFK